MVGHIEGGTGGEGVRGKDAAGDILGYKGRSKGDWRIPHKEELRDMYFSSDILLIFSRRMKWEGHVACMRQKKCIEGFGGETRGKKTTWRRER